MTDISTLDWILFAAGMVKAGCLGGIAYLYWQRARSRGSK